MNDLSEYNPYDPPRAPVGTASGDGGQGKRRKSKHIEGSPWLAIWTRPRSTIRTIVDTSPTQGFVVLATCYGVGKVLDRLANNPRSVDMSTGVLFGTAAVGGLFGGVFGLYLLGSLFEKTGQWLGGRADAQEVRAALAWGSVPSLVTLAFTILMIIAFGTQIDRAAKPILLAYFACVIVFGIWTSITTVECIGEVQRFSFLKAFGSIVLGSVVFVGAILLLVLLVVLASAALKAT